MIRIILLIFILIAISFIVTSKSSYLKEKNENWEYIKNNLFDGKTATFKKLKGPILIDLRNANSTDSLLIAEIINEIREILPHKEIDFLESYTGKTYQQFFSNYSYSDIYKGYKFKDILDSQIIFEFQKGKIQPLPNQEITRIYNGYGITNKSYKRYDNDIFGIHQAFLWLGEDTFSRKLKKNILRGEVFRGLCFPQNDNQKANQSSNLLEMQLKRESVFKRKSDNIYTPVSEKDIFLLQKLYEPDFLNQFKTYLTESYSWFYMISFLDKNLVKIIAVTLLFLIGIIAFFLLFPLLKTKKFKIDFFNYFVPIFFVWNYFFSLTSLYYYLTSFTNYQNNYKGYWFFHFYFLIASITSTILLYSLEKIFLKKRHNFTFIIISKIVFTFIAFSVPRVIEILMSSNTYILNYLFSLEFYFYLSLAIARGLLIYLNHFSESLVKEKNLELSKLKEINALSEMKLLQSQINPHFLYNSLNSIASLAKTDADKTQKMAHSLSDLFKYSINRKGKENSTIKDEIEMVKTYLEIEKIRFGEHLQFHIDVDASLESKKIPLFLIQPLVENAIKHGVSKNVAQGIITIKIEKQQEEIFITVADNGPNFPEGLLSGHGLQTVYDLLRLNYKDNASLNWTNTPEKKITITILDKK